ncbi:uncharacterized protein LOC106673629 [Cimex lectularius]|uniref:Aromatic amino acid beta-eliminating lyase/threonine aldolase domain-containing protein n=1 Tax=Cimex lectularius TaxID=79782 RepID=A0A8I6SCM1_CIMLE|nr:uncharacterized protein LOC106673629 [Cimex lectularius]
MHARIFCRSLRQLNEAKNYFEVGKASIYNAQESLTYPKNVRIVDYRSDTFSKPSKEMRQVMFEAKVGDDVYGEDPTVNALEEKGAKMLNKETSLFVASGTMANLLAIMTHADNRGCEIIVGEDSHILLWEQAGAAQIAGVQLRSVPNFPNGTFSVKEMLQKFRRSQNFQPRTSLVCVENTHNSCGGRVTPLSWLRELSDALKDTGVPLHMDGARFFNSVVSSKVPAHEIVRDCDSINVCLSKGLGAPIGSLLIGKADFIHKARQLRKVLGGGMRQVGLVAAAGIYALDHMVERLEEDHIHARTVAKGIHDMKSQVVQVDLDSLETNILLIHVDTHVITSQQFCKRLASITKDELDEGIETAVKILPWTTNIARLVVCCNNNAEDAEATVKKMQFVIRELDEHAKLNMTSRVEDRR